MRSLLSLIFVVALTMSWRGLGATNLTGRIILPSPINPANLFPEMFRDQATVPGGSCTGNASLHYPAVSPSTLNLNTFFSVRITPLDPSKSHLQYHATVRPDGSFTALVPSNEKGYCIAANADKVRFLRCLPQAFLEGASIDTTIELSSTVLAFAQLMSGRDFSSPVSLISSRLQQAILNAQQTFEQRISGALNAEIVSAVAALLGIPMEGNLVRKWTSEDKVPYAISSPTDINSPTTYSFNDSQALDLLTGSYLNDLKFSVSEGSLAKVTKSSAGFVKVVGLKPKEELSIVLPSNIVKTIGLRLANGNGPGASNIRRAFRLRVYSKFGSQMGFPLNWYTNQTGAPGFYGITINSGTLADYKAQCVRPDGKRAYCEAPIYRVAIQVSESVADTKAEYDAIQSSGDPFYIDDLTTSSSYSPQQYLGWKSDGWQLSNQFSPEPAGNFNHFLQNRDSLTGPDPEHACTFDNNFSGGNYWRAAYPDVRPNGWIRKTLTSPSFTLSNLPLDGDDILNTNTWLTAPLSVPMDRLYAMAVRNMAINQCPMQYTKTMDPYNMTPTSPGAWNDPFAPIEFALIKARCDLLDTTNCDVAPWKDWPTLGFSPNYNHWTHIHWQANAAVERSYDGKVDALMNGSSPSTRIKTEYSTDNGATWREIYWNRDIDHRGVLGRWNHNHNHPFLDSYVQNYIDNYKYPWDSRQATPKRACKNTDFWKSGWRKTQEAYRNGVYNYDFQIKNASGQWIVGFDQKGARDNNDSDWDGECREWDTEVYQDYLGTAVAQNVDNCCRDNSFLSPILRKSYNQVDVNGCLVNASGQKAQCSDDPVVLGTTLKYRFVFETNAGMNDIQCHRFDGVLIPCTGVQIDDVSFSNDSLQGYYTNFDSFESPNLGK